MFTADNVCNPIIRSFDSNKFLILETRDLSKLSNEDSNKKNKPIRKHDIKKQIGVNFFKNPNDLKRGIIMKEILDKPRALRKNII